MRDEACNWNSDCHQGGVTILLIFFMITRPSHHHHRHPHYHENQCHNLLSCLAYILILLLFMFCKSTININITFHSIKGTRQFQSSIPSFCPKKGNFNTTNTKRQFQSCKSGKCTECTFNSDCPGSRVIQEY